MSPRPLGGTVLLVTLVFVLRAGRTYELAATNEMGESTLATPALSEGTMFWRTQGHVLAIR
jgi:hypothetical protein